MKLLITGFEPFGGSDVNPSQMLCDELRLLSIDGVEVVTQLLPVDYMQAAVVLRTTLEEHAPAWVICLGQALGRASLNIELMGINLLDFNITDNSGAQLTDTPIVPHGPAAYFATLPVRRMCEAVRAAGVPADLSLSAGTFICNQVLYLALHYAATERPEMMAGFVHVPALPQQVTKRSGTPSMALETMLIGVRAAIAVVTAHT